MSGFTETVTISLLNFKRMEETIKQREKDAEIFEIAVKKIYGKEREEIITEYYRLEDCDRDIQMIRYLRQKGMMP